MDRSELLNVSASIVSAYLSRNKMPPEKVGPFFTQTFQQVISLLEEPIGVGQEPIVPIDESYTDDFIICLEDGKKVTLLKRYLRKHYDMSPEDYLEKWGLPSDYPFVTKAYSEKRSQIAKNQGLGRN